MKKSSFQQFVTCKHVYKSAEDFYFTSKKSRMKSCSTLTNYQNCSPKILECSNGKQNLINDKYVSNRVKYSFWPWISKIIFFFISLFIILNVLERVKSYLIQSVILVLSKLTVTPVKSSILRIFHCFWDWIQLIISNDRQKIRAYLHITPHCSWDKNNHRTHNKCPCKTVFCCWPYCDKDTSHIHRNLSPCTRLCYFLCKKK